MQSDKSIKTMSAILSALKMRLYLSLGFGYSKLFPRRDVLLIQADKNARRRATFLQRLPARILILVTVALYFAFFVAEAEAGLIIILFLLPPFIIPLAVLLGAYVTTRVDSIDVRLRREYARLCVSFAASESVSEMAMPKRSIDERLRDRRANWYKETRRILRQSNKARVGR